MLMMDEQAYALQLFTTLGGRAAADVQKLCADAVEEVLTGKVHAYSYLWHIIGRKPEKA